MLPVRNDAAARPHSERAVLALPVILKINGIGATTFDFKGKKYVVKHRPGTEWPSNLGIYEFVARHEDKTHYCCRDVSPDIADKVREAYGKTQRLAQRKAPNEPHAP